MMYVYVISGGPEAQKIGITNDATARLKALQTGHWAELTLEFAVRHQAAQQVERLAHEIAAAWRLKGEWFRMDTATAIAVVSAAVRRLTGAKDAEWEEVGGWDHSVGDAVICRHTGEPGFPGEHPSIGQRYTISEVYEDGTVAVAEIDNEMVAFCPSMFRPTSLA